jgi:hypothetical protein
MTAGTQTDYLTYPTIHYRKPSTAFYALLILVYENSPE